LPRSVLGVLFGLLFPFLPALAGDQTVLKCEPPAIRGVPGEPLRVSLTVESPSASQVLIHIPEIPFLSLRAVEKIPVRLSGRGTVIHERIVIWQGLEAGRISLGNLTADIDGKSHAFPPIEITVDALPPKK